jgi:hypothetical protein
MKRLALILVVLAAASLVGGASAGTAASAHRSATLCVGQRPGCYHSLQPAFDAAADGDTIRIDPGTYAGGVTLDKSVAVVGSGATRTIIRGGGPVLTIGVAGDPNADKLTVSLSGITVTGGVSTTAPTPNGPIDFVALAGGIEIPSGPPGTVGATVTIRDSAITGNRSTPKSSVPDSDCPDGVTCVFSQALAGGIADVGRLTLVHTVVSDNVAGGGPTSHAAGGGIWTATNSGPGSLTLIDSTVSDNRAVAVAPNGRFAEGGGIEVQDGETFVAKNTTFDENMAAVSGTYPEGVEMFANSGGLHIGGSGSAVLDNVRLTHNVASANDASGFPAAADAAFSDGLSDCTCGQTLVMRDSVIRENRVVVHAASSEDGQSGSALEIDGQADVRNLAVEDNSTLADNAGSAYAIGTFLTIDFDSPPVIVRDSRIRDNVTKALSQSGPARIQGGGLTNAGPLELRNDEIRGNVAIAHGDSGFARGGGIWNGQPFGSDGAPTPSLTLVDTHVTGNVLAGSPGVTLQGGGLYTVGFPVTLTRSIIARNVPDQCYGC